MNKNSENMQETTKILYASFEAAPFAKSGGLGEVAGSLPRALSGLGMDARLIIPKFGSIPSDLAENMVHIADFTLPLAWRRQYCGLEKLTLAGREIYFIDNEYYFKRPALYGYDDDAERIAFFAKAVVEAVPYLAEKVGFAPQILHCNDWHTALTPVFLREHYQGVPACRGLKTVFSIHNLQFQGKFDPFILQDVLGLECAVGQLVRDGAVNYLLGAARYADRLLTVSPTYAEEICTVAGGEGLDDVFAGRREVLGGILNGIDTEVYNPASDEYLLAQFAAEDVSGKALCKQAVQAELGLEQDERVPLLVLISRLTEQKGLDLLLEIMEELLAEPVQVAVLGVGDARYEEALRRLAVRHPNLAVRLVFDDGWAHRMYAGADMLLMPSRFEPCGLAQMIAMRYGTVPIVRATGGLRDSVEPWAQGRGNGFCFDDYAGGELLGAIQRALAVWADEEEWHGLVCRAMSADFSWRKSAAEYAAVYRELLEDGENS